MKIDIDFSEFEVCIKNVEGLMKHSVDIGLTKASEFVNEYAIYNEYGTRSIPSRPFYRTALINGMRRQMLELFMKDEVEKVYYANADWKDVYTNIGKKGESLLVDSLLRGGWTPLSEWTIKKKGRSTPLIDTSDLLNSIGSEVK